MTSIREGEFSKGGFKIIKIKVSQNPSFVLKHRDGENGVSTMGNFTRKGLLNLTDLLNECVRNEQQGYVQPAPSEIEQALSDPDHPYHDLADVLEQAFRQASGGKGRERHANDLPFNEQRMQTIARGQGHSGGMIYQIAKKAQESERLPRDAALRELLGVIVYAGGAFIYRKGDE